MKLGPGNDTIFGSVGSDVIHLGAGDDSVPSARRGNDTICGGAGNDWLNGERSNDVLYGGPGNDTILGGDGQDALHADAGSDSLIGGAGINRFVAYRTECIQIVADRSLPTWSRMTSSIFRIGSPLSLCMSGKSAAPSRSWQVWKKSSARTQPQTSYAVQS
ncbi:calcium-binding protein [Paracoccus sp. (in: a-proteobacteria)]|uniref:calcium-binding protein n=1 Tax=Paracoccus sp. TaxID=267 RepID=UPI0035AFFED6